MFVLLGKKKQPHSFGSLLLNKELNHVSEKCITCCKQASFCQMILGLTVI